MRKPLVYLLAAMFSFISIYAQPNVKHVKIKAQPSKTQVKNGEDFSILLTFSIDKYWYTYSLKNQVNKEGIGPTQTEIKLVPSNLVQMKGKVQAEPPHVKLDHGFEMKIEYYTGSAKFLVNAVAKKDLDFSKDKVFSNVFLQLCDTTSCLPPEEYRTRVLAQAYNPQDVTFASNSEQTAQDTSSAAQQAPAQQISKPKNEPEQHVTSSNAEIESKKKEGVFSFIWFSISAGLLALLTPCVFPMVPITVSFFTKRAEKAKGKGLRDSIVYALGIITTFTALGFILALVFGATGIQDFATNPWINLFIAAIFIVFALNLFGAFELQLPTGLLNKLNSKSQGSGILSVLLMGLTFSLTSFTCTVPFVGSALVSASGGEWFYPIIGMLAFSTVFAAPFFLLALFPSAMSKMPKAGGWMNNVKVVMGFLEIAASIKFLSNADLVWSLGIMPPELFLGIWIGICVLITFYILGLFRLSHDSIVESVKTMRVVFSIFFISIAFYMMGGLFGKHLGELNAFLPPPDYWQLMSTSTKSTASLAPVAEEKSSEELTWLNNYQQAVEESKKQNIPLFIDFTGFTCTNCRWMENNMFAKPSVKGLLHKMVRVRLYTDRQQEPFISNKNFQKNKFNSIELPLYVILKPDGTLVGTKAFTRDENDFVNFMQEALK